MIQFKVCFGLFRSNLIGEELFCLPDWNVIIKKLVDYHMTPTYISTKCPISRNMVKKLYETGYDDVVQISLDSMRDDVLGNIIGTKTGYVEKIKKTISYLQEYGFQIQIDTILTNLNSSSEELMELYDYIKDITTVQRNFPIRSTDHYRSHSEDFLV